MIVLQQAYRKPPVRFLELWEQSGWLLKVYGIAYQGEYPRARLIEKAKELASEGLLLLAGTEGCYDVGFLGVHDGRGADVVFID
jgi:hypothetical protein